MGDAYALSYARVPFIAVRVAPTGWAAMQQIADWLQKLGLRQYAQRFAENDINFAILPDLTDQDLKELGVASAGAIGCGENGCGIMGAVVAVALPSSAMARRS
jgi:hypothetical protein